MVPLHPLHALYQKSKLISLRDNFFTKRGMRNQYLWGRSTNHLISPYLLICSKNGNSSRKIKVKNKSDNRKRVNKKALRSMSRTSMLVSSIYHFHLTKEFLNIIIFFLWYLRHFVMKLMAFKMGSKKSSLVL